MPRDNGSARLEPALRLAARCVENEKLPAIGYLLKALERLNKQGAVSCTADRYTAESRERLLNRLSELRPRASRRA